MPGLGNPSVTSPRLGDRNHRANRGPRDLTGREYQRLHAEHDAKKAAASIDIAEVRRAEFQRGFDAAWEQAFNAGWDALAAYLVAEGVLDPDDEPGDEDGAE